MLDEAVWRSESGKGSGWGTSMAIESRPTPEDVTHVYRALRKAREDARDAPGAADFYYGEMDLRRRSERRLRLERVLLFAYWLVSGYGVRPTRTLLALLVTLACFEVALMQYGFSPPGRPYGVASTVRAKSNHRKTVRRAQSLSLGTVARQLRSSDGWTYTLSAAASPLSAPEATLTATGRILRVILRVIGPLLLALAALAFRSRVKR